MTPTEKAIRDFCGHHADWWPSTTQVQEMLALAQPEQEPVAFICEFYADEGHPFVSFEPVTHGTNTPLYTTPPQRKPQYDKTKMNCFVQDLYDKKIQEGKHGHYEAMFHVVHRAIEAAHGIKE